MRRPKPGAALRSNGIIAGSHLGRQCVSKERVNPANAANREIERRFLAGEIPADLISDEGSEIEQGYLADSPVVVRLRRVADSGEGFFLTAKCGPLEDREEREIALSRDQFLALWPLTAGRRIRKRRRRIPWRQWTIEFDVFEGVHAGLRIAEIEFPSLEASRELVVPDWFGVEVTGDPAYANAALARET